MNHKRLLPQMIGLMLVMLLSVACGALQPTPLSDRLIPNDPYFGLQWGLDAIKAPEAWRITTGDAATLIAILAGGVDIEHPDLKSKIVADYDLANTDAVPQDQLGFGTVLAGIAAASTNNSSGIAGVSWEAKVLSVRILDAEGGSYDSDVIAGILYAVAQGADIVVIPLEFIFPSVLLRIIVEYEAEEGTLVIVSVSPGEGVSLASEPGVLGVCGLSRAQINEAKLGPTIASTPESQKTAFICAPAEDGAGTFPGSVYEAWSHEYLATGYAAGVAALAWSVNPELTVAEMKDLLLTSASDLGPPGYDSQYGAGLLNAEAAVRAALSKASSPDSGTGTR